MTGVIQSIIHAPSGGISTVIVLNENSEICLVHADAGPFFRAVGASGLHAGDEIQYETTDLGTMIGFTLVRDAQ